MDDGRVRQLSGMDRISKRVLVAATQGLCRLQFIQPPKPADDVKNCVKVINYTVNTQEKK